MEDAAAAPAAAAEEAGKLFFFTFRSSWLTLPAGRIVIEPKIGREKKLDVGWEFFLSFVAKKIQNYLKKLTNSSSFIPHVTI